MKGKYLITTSEWFVAPDGKTYQAVWGNVEIRQDDKALGVKTNRQSTNWYAKIGTKENHVIVAGCQIFYACKAEKRPNDKPEESWMAEAGKGFETYKPPCRIYFAE